MDIIENLRHRAAEATHQAIHHTGVAEGLTIAADIVLEHGITLKKEPEPQLSLPAPAPQSRRPVPTVSASKKAKSAEIMAPVFDLLRERGTSMTVAEVVEALQGIDINASEVVAIRALMAGVRAGHLSREGDTYRSGKLKR